MASTSSCVNFINSIMHSMSDCVLQMFFCYLSSISTRICSTCLHELAPAPHVFDQMSSCFENAILLLLTSKVLRLLHPDLTLLVHIGARHALPSPLHSLFDLLCQSTFELRSPRPQDTGVHRKTRQVRCLTNATNRILMMLDR